jgi:hypothetical protein
MLPGSSTTVIRFPTWRSINDFMAVQYGKWYTPGELRAMELKWKRAFAEGGFNTKGQ